MINPRETSSSHQGFPRHKWFILNSTTRNGGRCHLITLSDRWGDGVCWWKTPQSGNKVSSNFDVLRCVKVNSSLYYVETEISYYHMLIRTDATWKDGVSTYFKKLFKDYELRHYMVQIIFCINFTLSLTMFELIIFEISDTLERSSRYFHWYLSLYLTLFMVIIMTPLYLRFVHFSYLT